VTLLTKEEVDAQPSFGHNLPRLQRKCKMPPEFDSATRIMRAYYKKDNFVPTPIRLRERAEVADLSRLANACDEETFVELAEQQWPAADIAARDGCG